jgi:hypothetical protein
VKQIDEGLGHGHIVGDAVIERFITAVERISRNIVRDDLGATRYVEMLEKFAESDGEKTLILGPDHAYLGPARTRQSETP